MNEVPISFKNMQQNNPYGEQRGGGNLSSVRQGNKIKVIWILIIVIIVVLLSVGYYFIFLKNTQKKVSFVNSLKYQSVFLSNGQIYFGKVSNENNQYVSLADVYYLVLKQPLQSQTDQGTDQTKNGNPEYSLIKLGKELHGPTDMTINRDQILFIENLSDDSKVVSAIKGKK